MQFKHSNRAVSVSFDDPTLVSSAGLIPMMVLAVKTGLGAVVDERVKLPGYFGANAGLKVIALVAGMLTGAGCCEYGKIVELWDAIAPVVEDDELAHNYGAFTSVADG